MSPERDSRSALLEPPDGPQPEPSRDPLRVAVITASLGLAGAEKQAFYITRALFESGVDVRIFNIGRGGQYEDELRRLNVKVKCIGWLPTPVLRAGLLLGSLARFRPHVVQSVHSYTNIYSAFVGRMLNALSVGGLRSDLNSCLADNGRFGKRLLMWPDAIAANSKCAIEEARQQGLPRVNRFHFLPNAIDLARYPDWRNEKAAGVCECIWVSRLFPLKRADLFVRALARARSQEPGIRGTVVGYGPESERIQQLAAELGLLPDGLRFLGFRDDVAELLQQADVFVFSSESEGTPNVILEAMAASLPVIATPAGDAADMVESAGAGCVVPFGDLEAMTAAIVDLARSPSLRRRYGKAGREYLARHHSSATLGVRLLNTYGRMSSIAKHGRPHPILRSGCWNAAPGSES